ncbi:kynureninase/PvdN C-terminal domain-containing protein [Legionella fallonii]|uniref:Kynureninase n=1 Tax=Legionella fallonii LLAP-10 TaxID=1212491 RepID=A0A098G162_9GAMM|nr:hypothetical protein [Legionella fallonii]CEG55724.1 Kynureninase [Legionella fallonii LLAP-10]
MINKEELSQLVSLDAEEFMRRINEEPSRFSLEFAKHLDAQDPLKDELKDCFELGEVTAFAGHSLGPAFRPAKEEIAKTYNLQRDKLHAGHFPETKTDGGNWFDCDIDEEALLAMQKMLGFADLSEFVFTQKGLSDNLANLLDTFYKPLLKDWQRGQTKICHLATEFFSDQAIVHSIIARGIDNAAGFEVFDDKTKPEPGALILKLQPDKNGLFSEDKIIAEVKEHAHEIQILHLSDVIFGTGQRLDIPYILSQLQDEIVSYDIKVGLDFAHTVGNRTINLAALPLVTYAVGCGYKHCGGTAGSGFGFYVNKKADLQRYKPIQGWKAALSNQVFAHINGFNPQIMYQSGAWAFRTSNVSPVAIAPIQSFIKKMSAIGWDRLMVKSECLTRYLQASLNEHLGDKIQFITPGNPKQRGAMLVFRVNGVTDVQQIEELLKQKNELGQFEIDVRKPNNIRVTAHYGYTQFTDIQRFVCRLNQVIQFALTEQKNKEAITQEINKLTVVNYDSVSELLPKLLQEGKLTLDHSIYTPLDPTSDKSTSIGRYLVYDHPDKDNPFSIWVFAFAPRQKTSIHDHQYKGTVIVLEGPISEKYYQPTGENTAQLIRSADRHRLDYNRDNLDSNFVHQLKRRKGVGDGTSVTLHIYNMDAYRVTPEGTKSANRNLLRIYSNDKIAKKSSLPDYRQEYPTTLRDGPLMKPILASCSGMYSVSHPDEEEQYFVTFQLTFAESAPHGRLTIKTDKDHRTAIESQLELYGQSGGHQFEPWQEASWQNALLKAWIRYTSVTGYCAAITNDLVYELQEREDNSFGYELTLESQKIAKSMYPSGTMINEDGSEAHVVMVPESQPEWFVQPTEALQNCNGRGIGCLDILFAYIDFRIASGFMIALGLVALTVAFTSLNAATLGVAGVVVGGLGLASIASGIGFFRAGYECSDKEPEPELSLNSICPSA